MVEKRGHPLMNREDGRIKKSDSKQAWANLVSKYAYILYNANLEKLSGQHCDVRIVSLRRGGK